MFEYYNCRSVKLLSYNLDFNHHYIHVCIHNTNFVLYIYERSNTNVINEVHKYEWYQQHMLLPLNIYTRVY